MRLVALGFLLLTFAAPGRAEQVPVRCGPMAMPSALDSAPGIPEARSVVGFSAEPSQVPGRAWVVRAYRSGPGSAALDVVRLRRQPDCNAYEPEARWTGPLSVEEYRALVRAAAPLGTPRADAFTHDDPARDGEGIALDGTMIELRLIRTGWEARRDLNHHGKGGAAISALFHPLVARLVPAAELPAADWRTRRGR